MVSIGLLARVGRIVEQLGPEDLARVSPMLDARVM